MHSSLAAPSLRTHVSPVFHPSTLPAYTQQTRDTRLHAPQTPALLQLSGIGPAPALAALGIPVAVPLAGVGRALVEQTEIALVADTAIEDAAVAVTDAIGFPDVGALFAAGAVGNTTAGNVTEEVGEEIYGNIAGWAQMLAARGAGVSKEALEEVFRVQARMVLEDRGACVIMVWRVRCCVVVWELSGRVLIEPRCSAGARDVLL